MARYIGNLALKDEDNLCADNNGNILKKTTYSYTNPATALSVSNRDGYECQYSYSSVWIDQLTAISSYDCYGTQSLTPTVSYVSNYDGSGNPTSYLGSTLSWQGKRLTGVNSSTIYTYDENGLRTSKTVSGTTTEYYYNGSVLIGMKKGTGSTAIVQRFSYDSSGKVVAVDYSDDSGEHYTTYYYLRNGQGDIVALINDSGTKVIEYTYDTWGKQLSCTDNTTTALGLNQPFRYRGYVYDTETGWYYLQSRYYNPEVGRFISSDVLLSTGQGVLGHNAYAYCLNNPVNMSDSSGHAAGYVNYMETDKANCLDGTPREHTVLLHCETEDEKAFFDMVVETGLFNLYSFPGRPTNITVTRVGVHAETWEAKGARALGWTAVNYGTLWLAKKALKRALPKPVGYAITLLISAGQFIYDACSVPTGEYAQYQIVVEGKYTYMQGKIVETGSYKAVYTCIDIQIGINRKGRIMQEAYYSATEIRLNNGAK